MPERKNTLNRTNARNNPAGVLLLGGVILGLGSLLKAAEKYLPDSKNIEQEAMKCYNIFETELKDEITERRKNPANARQTYLMDLMLEDMLGYSSQHSDTTIEYQEELEEFVKDIYKSAIDKSLKKFEWYSDLKENVKSRVLNFNQEDAPENKGRYKISFLADRSIETGLHPSLRKGELDISAYAGLKNFKLLGIGFDGANLEVGTNKLRAGLEKAISNEIFSRFDIELDEFQNPSLSFSLTGERNKGKWVLSAGYCNGSEKSDEVYANFGFVSLLP